MIGHRCNRIACLILGLAACGLLAATNGARAADVDENKLLGKWEVTKVNGGKPEVATEYEFQKGGKLNYTFSGQSGEGVYRLKGNKLTIKINPPKGAKKGLAFIVVVDKLTDDTLVVSGDRGGEKAQMEFKKK
jgi:uncharacterized protein (TIGR03066 family)